MSIEVQIQREQRRGIQSVEVQSVGEQSDECQGEYSIDNQSADSILNDAER